MNTLPKSKCPPAKPPRRKLSYSSESGKGTSDSSSIHPASETDKINKSKIQIDNAVNYKLAGNLTEITRNQNLSKSSSSASSASKESGGSPFTDIGSDYGSFQGEQFNLPSSECNIDFLTRQWPNMPSKSTLRTPQKALFYNFPSGASTSHSHCCSSSTPIKSPHSLMPHSTPLNSKNNSVYYTPPCNTPHSCKKNSNEESSFSNDSFICDLPDKPICCGVERRHNSDPQISLERRPSRRFKNGNKSSLLSRSKRTCVEDSSRRKKRSQSFVRNQHHHHHHHHRETEVNEAPRVLVFPQPSLCCLDSWRKNPESCGESLEDICHRIWKKHQSQSRNSQPDWSGVKTPSQVGTFPELLSEIYYAQKERDKASRERLEMVIEQRNKLMAEVESLKQIIFRQNIWRNESDEDENDSDAVGLDQILKGLDETYSPTKLEFHKEQILAKINGAIRGQRTVTHTSALNSRRGSSQPQSLMDELKNPAEIWNCDGFVCQKVSEERCKAMAAMQKMSEMEEELASLKLYSLQNYSLNGHDNSKSQDKMPKLRSDDDDDDDDDDEEEEIGVFHIDSVNSSVDEELRVKLQKEIKARHEAEDNCKKLERIVNVLRKKIAGVSIGIKV